MSGPYLVNQESFPCGCYYPDVVALSDHTESQTRHYHCILHGHFFCAWPPEGVTDPMVERRDVPSDEWRNEKRRMIQEHDRITSEI